MLSNTQTYYDFLQAIVLDPGNDAPRLVYADWLEDHGEDQERVELIRVQCEIAKTKINTSRFVDLDKHASQLLTLRNFHRWVTCFPLYGLSKWEWKWKRGFVEEIKLTNIDWLRECHNLIWFPTLENTCPLSAQPITTVHIYGLINQFDWYFPTFDNKACLTVLHNEETPNYNCRNVMNYQWTSYSGKAQTVLEYIFENEWPGITFKFLGSQ